MRSLSLAVGGLALTLAAAVPACTFVTNTTAIQCASESECLSLGPAFAGTTCSAETHTCVAIRDDFDLCTKNAECIDRAAGQPAICRKADRKCVPLLTPECDQVIAQPGELLNDDAVVVGYIAPHGITWDAGASDTMLLNVRLAQKEIASVGGLPNLSGGVTGRPFVILACREFQPNLGTRVGILAAMNHAVKNVRVPLVIGPVDPANQALLAQQVFLPNKVLNLIPNGSIPQLASFPNPIAPTPLLWELFPNITENATLFNELIAKKLEPELKKQGVDKVRVATMFDGGFFGRSSIETTLKTLRFNGMSAAENAAAIDPNTNKPYLINVNVGDLSDVVGNPTPTAKISAAVTAVYNFAPHIIIEAYFPGAFRTAMVPTILNWPMATPTPYHIDLVGAALFNNPDVPDIVDKGRLNGKFFDIGEVYNPAGTKTLRYEEAAAIPDQDRYTQYKFRLNTEFPDTIGNLFIDGFITQMAYDATYLAAYVVAANGNKPFTGENLAATLPKFLPGAGNKVVVGPADAPKALTALAAGQGIDIDGLIGNMDLDPRTANVRYRAEVHCMQTSTITGKAAGFAPSGFALDPGLATASGPFKCPGF